MNKHMCLTICGGEGEFDDHTAPYCLGNDGHGAVTSGDGAAQEYARIMTEIRSQMTGDPTHDVPLLLAYFDRYRRRPLNQEVVKEIGRMLYAALPPESRAKLDENIDDVYAPLATGFAEANRRVASGDFGGARQTLEGVIDQFDPEGDACSDDAVTEYRMFNDPYESALYQTLFQPTREVRRPSCDFVNLYLLYGSTLVELRDLDAAETALRRARYFSPVNPTILFELCEVLKLQQRWKEYHQLSTFALSVSFGAEQAARAYRNLGYYYIEQGNYDAAVACYQKSSLIDFHSTDRCTNELMFIQQKTGTPIQLADAASVDQTLRNNSIQVGLSDVARETLIQVGQHNDTTQHITQNAPNNSDQDNRSAFRVNSPAGPTPDPATCQACGRGPAAPLKTVKQTGMILARRSGTSDLMLCQSCGTAMFRDAQSHNLAFGWWGLAAFFSNFFSLAGNTSRSLKHRLIGPPTGTQFSSALDPGRPVWLRVQIIVPVILAALAVAGIISATSHEKVGGLHAGQCINIPSAGSFSDVTLVPCEEPHDAEVAGILPGSTPASVDLNEACIRLAAENVLLSKARSVTPGTLVRAPTTEQTGTSKPAKSKSETPRAICTLEGLDGAKLTDRVTGGDGGR